MSLAVALPTLSAAKEGTIDLSLPVAVPHGRMEQAGVSVDIDVLDAQHTVDIFDVDLIKKGVQPVMIKIHNHSMQTYRFKKSDVDAHYIPAAVAAKKAYENPVRIGGRFVRRAVGTIPRWLLNAPSGIAREHAADQPLLNREMQASFVRGEIADADIAPNATLEGFLYLKPLQPGVHVRIPLLNTSTQELLMFDRAR
ncbi:MAG: hypothetical protein HY352_00815 [Candidatus Omnitrophica bacterium]|nr:hypothetical protein [Candidatus Omnitrophota bacterium]